jgi:hypothetical protein
VSSASKPCDTRALRRLEVFLDVAYALLFAKMLDYLPRFEDMSWADRPWGLLQLFIDRPIEVMRIAVGVTLILLYWRASCRLLGPLVATDARCSALSLLQLVFVCLFIYFAIADPGLSGGPSSPALQSLSLAVAGSLGVVGWTRARRRGLIKPELDERERDQISRRMLIEPVAALLTIGMAFIGPVVWTLAWLAIPVALAKLLHWRAHSDAAPLDPP